MPRVVENLVFQPDGKGFAISTANYNEKWNSQDNEYYVQLWNYPEMILRTELHDEEFKSVGGTKVYSEDSRYLYVGFATARLDWLKKELSRLEYRET